jgi:hypothetical protein
LGPVDAPAAVQPPPTPQALASSRVRVAFAPGLAVGVTLDDHLCFVTVVAGERVSRILVGGSHAGSPEPERGGPSEVRLSPPHTVVEQDRVGSANAGCHGGAQCPGDGASGRATISGVRKTRVP